MLAFMVRETLRFFVVTLALCVAPAAASECVPSFDPLAPAAQVAVGSGALPPMAPPAEAAIGATRSDRFGRMVAPVMINGEGPYRFIVDTGANRSVISHGVMQLLGLQSNGIGNVHTIEGVTTAPLVQVDTLEYGDLNLPSAQMPVMGGAMLAGEQGLLGVDGMIGRRLRLDFEQRCIEIVPSRGARPLRSGWTLLRGELRFGHLVVVRGTINGVRVNVLIDTGSNTSLANMALRDLLSARARRNGRALDVARAYTAGQPIVLDSAIMVPRLELNQMAVQDMLLYVGDFHVFSLWGMEDEPTLLIGMDVLTTARGLAIDFERGNVYFQLQPRVRLGSRIARQ